ncbi:hypothetical protein [Planomonospora parontospora]|uniref:hypothetical protein n=1 Tax=Planomonospora parontospora TaxID=58119 RepID=UPI00167004B0|nr:hypothetical protein [Planomonospora parontospora]GGL14765.1 hypothetical protein GCM10014719_15890 [Planomonospora parontospora subsp. antibiotica]GII15864.1 hypothetical protein Ppa05_25900 [Planomonospora parontospora subsp. antibiotica]
MLASAPAGDPADLMDIGGRSADADDKSVTGGADDLGGDPVNAVVKSLTCLAPMWKQSVRAWGISNGGCCSAQCA